MKKLLTCLLAPALALCITACGHQHAWTPATCAQPETCECGETQGEALGHDWRPADCTDPETCSRCGETRGEPLGHRPTEVNHQDAPVCTVCGEIVGEPLQAGFPAHGLAANMELGVPANYHTTCADEAHETVAQATVTDYRVFQGDESHEAKPGFEWRCVQLRVEYTDENTLAYGV